MGILKRLTAEFIGTGWLVLGGCGSAVLAAAFPNVGIGLLGVSLAFGLTVLTMAYAVGHISGCHLNPAVSVGLFVGGRFPAKDLLPYIMAQVAGGILGAAVLYAIERNGDLQSGWRLRGQRLRGPLTRALQSAVGVRLRSSHDFLFSVRHPWLNAWARAEGVCSARHRLLPHADPSGEYSGYEYVREPGAQHRNSPVRWRLGALATVDVLGSSAVRRDNRRRRLSVDGS